MAVGGIGEGGEEGEAIGRAEGVPVEEGGGGFEGGFFSFIEELAEVEG